MGQLALFAKESQPPTTNRRKSNHPSGVVGKNKSSSSEKWDNLRQRLTTQLVTGKAEGMVCLDKIKPVHATWDCQQQCYQVSRQFSVHKQNYIGLLKQQQFGGVNIC